MFPVSHQLPIKNYSGHDCQFSLEIIIIRRTKQSFIYCLSSPYRTPLAILVMMDTQSIEKATHAVLFSAWCLPLKRPEQQFSNAPIDKLETGCRD